jgi:hypothetical protein
VKSESVSPLLRVRDWDRLYENNRSRDLGRTDWFPAPNNLSADSYVDLVSHVDGAAHFGVWNALLMVASRAKPRGALVRDDGRTHDAESLARVTRLPQQLIKAGIERLLEIGLLEKCRDNPRKKSNLGSHPSAAQPQEPAPKSHEGAAEGNGTEHHHQEGQRKRRKGMERARSNLTTESSGVASDRAFSSLEKGVDDDENSGTSYASPEDELKSIYRAKADEPMTIDLLDVIRVNLEFTGVSMNDYVIEVKKHAQNKWRNPAGFLRNLSSRFRAKTRAATEPVTAAEATARNYRCSLCGSRVRGEGAVSEVWRESNGVPSSWRAR